jgi:hypothetical protein
MDPVKYNRDGIFTNETLLQLHSDQLSFGAKVLPLLKNYNFDNPQTIRELNDRYGLFLTLCVTHKKKCIVPTLIEDFVWHAHMTDHEDYVNGNTNNQITLLTLLLLL